MPTPEGVITGTEIWVEPTPEPVVEEVAEEEVVKE